MGNLIEQVVGIKVFEEKLVKRRIILYYIHTHIYMYVYVNWVQDSRVYNI
jgi:hypothetical protein